MLRNGKLIDFDGEREIPEFYKTFAENEMDEVSSHRAFKEGDLPDAPRGTEVEVNELADMITPSTGDIRFSVSDELAPPSTEIKGESIQEQPWRRNPFQVCDAKGQCPPAKVSLQTQEG